MSILLTVGGVHLYQGSVHETLGNTPTWVQKNILISTNSPLAALHFVDNNTGWVVGHDGSNKILIQKTTDGGLSWVRQNVPTIYQPGYLTDVYFVDQYTGYTIGNDVTYEPCLTRVFKTTDGGATWNTMPNLLGLNLHLFDMQFSGSTGYVVGKYSQYYGVFKTTNAGTGWTYTPLNPSNATDCLYGVSMISNNVVLTCGTSGSAPTMLKTTNGTSWVAQTLPSGIGTTLKSVFMIDAYTGYTCGSKILKTMDGGASWSIQTAPTGFYNKIYFLNASTGWAVGFNGANLSIIKTTDGGATWVADPSSVTTTQLNDIMFTDSHTGWTAGYSINNALVMKDSI